MPQEYYIPAPEGPIPRGASILRIFRPDEMPVKIGSLEREAFSYLGDWNVFMDSAGYGIAYRLGMKEGLEDDEGDPVTVCLHFAHPVVQRGKAMTPEIARQQFEKLTEVMEMFTVIAQPYEDNLLSVNPEPPAWMMQELEEMLQ